jgi:DNA ligase (NAD+)
MSEKRPTIDYEIDGLVFAAFDLSERDSAGMHGTKCPWGSVAFKFPAEQVVTTVLDIDRQVGRMGKLTPVARLQPILLAGSTISNISLHNEAYIRQYGVTVGCKVLIEKAGDIIPQVVRVVEKNLSYIGNIQTCPCCGGVVEMDENDVALWCVNINCPERKIGRLMHFIEAIDAKGVGDKLVQSLYEGRAVTEFCNFYELTQAQLVGRGIGEKTAKNTVECFESKRKLTLAVVLDSLGLDGLGTSTSKAMAAHFKTMQAVLEATEETLLAAGLPSVGEKTAKKIVRGLGIAYKEIDSLLNYVDIEEVVEVVGNLSGMSFCLTGAMPSGRKRAEVEKQIEAAGGTVKSSVGKGLTYLVQADPSSTSDKTQKAEKFGTKIISEDELMALMA